jgi:hypothetical protein
MKRVRKFPNSKVLTEGIVYIVNGNNSNLSQVLQGEQSKFCAFTEKQISSTDLVEIDHFDPTLKGNPGDNYNNWFAIVAKWNRKKSTKWAKYQPILYPISSDFSERIWYEDGIYQYNSDDIEAKNLMALLDINNYELTQERQRYIDRMKELEKLWNPNGLREYLLKHTDEINFLTAFETVFGYGFIFN